MKKIINGKIYNTETATKLFENGTGNTANFTDWYEEFYVTKKGAFFMKFWGGAMTRYSESFNNGRSRSEGRGIKVLTKEEVTKNLSNDSYNLDEIVINNYLEIEEA